MIPAFVLPTLTLAQTCCVLAKASGIDSINALSPAAYPFCTNAEYPPIKSTPNFCAQRSKVKAYSTGFPPEQATNIAIGVTLIRLLTTGIP